VVQYFAWSYFASGTGTLLVYATTFFSERCGSMANGFFFVARRTESRGKGANIDEQSTFETMLMQQV